MCFNFYLNAALLFNIVFGDDEEEEEKNQAAFCLGIDHDEFKFFTAETDQAMVAKSDGRCNAALREQPLL
jgi:hypothetical protein